MKGPQQESEALPAESPVARWRRLGERIGAGQPPAATWAWFVGFATRELVTTADHAEAYGELERFLAYLGPLPPDEIGAPDALPGTLGSVTSPRGLERARDRFYSAEADERHAEVRVLQAQAVAFIQGLATRRHVPLLARFDYLEWPTDGGLRIYVGGAARVRFSAALCWLFASVCDALRVCRNDKCRVLFVPEHRQARYHSPSCANRSRVRQARDRQRLRRQNAEAEAARLEVPQPAVEVAAPTAVPPSTPPGTLETPSAAPAGVS